MQKITDCLIALILIIGVFCFGMLVGVLIINAYAYEPVKCGENWYPQGTSCTDLEKNLEEPFEKEEDDDED